MLSSINSNIKTQQIVVNRKNVPRQFNAGIDTVCFTGKKEVESKETTAFDNLKLKARIFGRKIRGYAAFTMPEVRELLSKEIKKRNISGKDGKPIEIEYNMWASHKLCYNLCYDTITINHMEIESLEDIREIAANIEEMQQFDKRLGQKLSKITEQATEIIGLEEKNAPIIQLIHVESMLFGCYDPSSNRFSLNSYWLDGAREPEAFVAEIILHELSHAKTNIESLFIENEDLFEELKKHPELKKEIDKKPESMEHRDFISLLTLGSEKPEKGSPAYNRIMWHLITNLKDDFNPDKVQPSSSKVQTKSNNVKKHIASVCNIRLKDLIVIDLKSLRETGEVKSSKNNTICKILFDDSHVGDVIKKIEANKSKVIKILKSNESLFNKSNKGYDGYLNIYDEALARHNSSRGLREMIKKGLLPDNEATRALSLNEYTDLRDQVFKVDKEVREKIESGEVQLDAITLNFISKNNKKFNLDLSNQKGK